MDILWVGIGLVLLLGGGDVLVRGGVGLAARFGLSPAVIGAVVLGFGTSMPEMMTSLSAAFQGQSGIAIGNVVGSNIANILLILGVTAMVAPILRDRGDTAGIWAMLAATVVALVLLHRPVLGRVEGAVLLIGLAAYLWHSLKQPVDAPDIDVAVAHGGPPWRDIGVALAGLAVLLAGAHLFVRGATGVAEALQVPPTVIGLTLVAVGTSLPELVTSVIAALRGQGRMALGNVLGSNVFNILAILGVTAMVVPIPVPPMLSTVDLVAMAGAAVLLALVLRAPALSRGIGAGFVLLYAGYLVWLAASSA
jgi:cation:H+ antiporter